MRKLIILSVVIAALSWLIACSRSQNESVAPSEAKSAKSFEFFVSMKLPSTADVYWQAIEKGAIEKAKELGANVTVEAAPTADDATAQAKQIEAQIENGVAGIAVAPIDVQALLPAIEKAKAANIPLVLIDTHEALDGTSVLGTNNFEAGKLAADFICNPENNVLPRNSEVVLITGADGNVSKNRARGSRETLESCTFKIVAEQSANWNKTEAQSVMADILTRWPDIKAVVAMNDAMALGVVEAIKAAGKSGQVVVVGFDGNVEAVAAVVAGDMFATVAQNPYNMGAWGVENLYKLADGEIVPKIRDTGTILVTKDNADLYQ